jgi:hypothetical protein
MAVDVTWVFCFNLSISFFTATSNCLTYFNFLDLITVIISGEGITQADEYIYV